MVSASETQAASQLLVNAKRMRGVQSIQHQTIPNVGEHLEKVCRFLREHESPSSTDCTHSVFDNSQDWWQGTRPTYMLAIGDDETLSSLYKYIGNLYDMGIPLTLTEMRTPQFCFVQDVNILGSQHQTVEAAELLGDNLPFLQHLGKAVGEVYPNEPELDLVMFDATGKSMLKGVQKTSVRLVWANIVVDNDRAKRIHDFVVHKFNRSSDTSLKEFAKRIQSCSASPQCNQWSDVFNDVIYAQKKHGIRMPFCDIVSPRPLPKPEGRPFVPCGVARFKYNKGTLQSMDRICTTKDELQNSEWLKLGCIRRAINTPLTEWKAPTWVGQHSLAPSLSGGRSQPQPSKVNVRTKGGSPGDRPAPVRIQLAYNELRGLFYGTTGEFRQKFEKVVRSHDQEFVQDNNTLKWQRTEDPTQRVEFNASTHTVRIFGNRQQISNYLEAMRSFVSTPRGVRTSTGCSRAGRSREHTRLQPSSVFAPQVAHVASVAESGERRPVEDQSARCDVAPDRQSNVRVAWQDSIAKGATELSFSAGDMINIIQDPGDSTNINRWVFGQIMTTKQTGWFNFAFTQSTMEPMVTASPPSSNIP